MQASIFDAGQSKETSFPCSSMLLARRNSLMLLSFHVLVGAMADKGSADLSGTRGARFSDTQDVSFAFSFFPWPQRGIAPVGERQTGGGKREGLGFPCKSHFAPQAHQHYPRRPVFPPSDQ